MTDPDSSDPAILLMTIAAPNRTISIVIIVAMIGLSILNMAIYAGLFSSTPTPPQAQLSLPGLPEQTAAISQKPATTNSNQTLRRAVPSLIAISIIIIIGGLVSAVLLAITRGKKQRDSLRLADLGRISQGLEQYYNHHGHYPVSATYDSQYYSAINIVTEWSSYNFPPAEEMRALMPNWPPSDPTLSPTSSDQTGNYLYYPHHFGQRFSLYAQLEDPTQHPVPDYNRIDNLPPSTAHYNYRFNSPDHHSNPTQPLANLTQPPANAQPEPSMAPHQS